MIFLVKFRIGLFTGPQTAVFARRVPVKFRIGPITGLQTAVLAQGEDL